MPQPIPAQTSRADSELVVRYSFSQAVNIPQKKSSRDRVIMPDSRSAGIGGFSNFYRRSGIGNNIHDDRNSGIGKICVEDESQRSSFSSMRRRLSLRRSSSSLSRRRDSVVSNGSAGTRRSSGVGSGPEMDMGEEDIVARAAANFARQERAKRGQQGDIEEEVSAKPGGEKRGRLFKLLHRHEKDNNNKE
ncbi:hypothetical protein LPJ75_001489 [Coemansia sp. RSA 2598]|nr:hypothetical protein LPJ75_001489 [Coemansia sp. RSA 2598]